MIQQIRAAISSLCLLAALGMLIWDSRADRTRVVLALFLAASLMSGCTVATYTDPDGRRLRVLDLRLSGTATQVEVTRPDGTSISINRQQDSPEGTVTGVINATNPIGGLLP
jgi:hypothetical protein